MAGGGVKALWGVVWAVIVSSVSYLLVIRVPTEDMVLRKQFGEEWDRWAEKTRYRLIPGIY